MEKLPVHDLDACIRRLLVKSQACLEKSVDMYMQSAGRAKAAEEAALCMWVRRIEEDEDTQVLREQLEYLWEEGQFNLK